jgi:hypothetical protein
MRGEVDTAFVENRRNGQSLTYMQSTCQVPHGWTDIHELEIDNLSPMKCIRTNQNDIWAMDIKPSLTSARKRLLDRL